MMKPAEMVKGGLEIIIVSLWIMIGLLFINTCSTCAVQRNLEAIQDRGAIQDNIQEGMGKAK